MKSPLTRKQLRSYLELQRGLPQSDVATIFKLNEPMMGKILTTNSVEQLNDVPVHVTASNFYRKELPE